MHILKKRGMSPVIATILLVALGLILAVIIFLWARTFIGESVQKEGRNIEQSCEEVSFEAEIFLSNGKLSIENIGTVPIYGAELRKKQVIGEIKKVGIITEGIITAGKTGTIPLGDLELEVGDNLIVIPVLLGETENYKKAFICDKVYGVEVIVR